MNASRLLFRPAYRSMVKRTSPQGRDAHDTSIPSTKFVTITPMRIKLFIVFHRAIDERLILDQFTPDEVQTHFTLYGVNQTRTDKRITQLDGTTHPASPAVPNLLLEYFLPNYDPVLQERGFMEASAYIHLHKNGMHEPLDYIGVVQYDMRWTPAAVALLRGLVAATSHRNIVYGIICNLIANSEGRMHALTFPQHFDWRFLLQSYNRFFKQNWAMPMLVNKPLTLFQAYLMPKQEFASLASWLIVLCQELYPAAIQPPRPSHWGILGGWVERAESLFIAARLQEGGIILEPLPVHHDQAIVKKLEIGKEHYGGRAT
jgi:hypothetical protein